MIIDKLTLPALVLSAACARPTPEDVCLEQADTRSELQVTTNQLIFEDGTGDDCITLVFNDEDGGSITGEEVQKLHVTCIADDGYEKWPLENSGYIFQCTIGDQTSVTSTFCGLGDAERMVCVSSDGVDTCKEILVEREF